jgi:hypothetical protein
MPVPADQLVGEDCSNGQPERSGQHGGNTRPLALRNECGTGQGIGRANALNRDLDLTGENNSCIASQWSA